MNRIFFVFQIFALLSLLNACATVPWEPSKDDMKIVGNQIYRSDKSFTLNAVHEADLCSKGDAFEPMIRAMAKIGEVGGNAVSFDLCGFSEDGSMLAPQSVSTVGVYAERAKDQRMVLLVRVLGETGSPEFRARAVESAAKSLCDETRAVYWIDGPDAGALAAHFKKLAPKLVLAAPENGDIAVTRNPAEAGNSGLFLLVGALPLDPLGNVNYVLPGTSETYALLEDTYTTEIERTPWVPDNSLLSPEEQTEGFVSLFNGRDLNNWRSYFYGQDSFRVTPEGYIECYQAGAGGLVTRDRYDNFILRLEYRLFDEGSNSGIHLRAPRAARQSKLGFEFQLMGDSQLAVPEIHSTGAIYDVLPALAPAAKPEGEWNEVEIMLDGPRCRATLNGVLVQDLNFDEIEELRYRLRNGFIGLQDHDDYVQFRNIRIKRL